MKTYFPLLVTGVALFAAGCGQGKKANHSDADTVTNKSNQEVDLPAPYATDASTKFSNVIGWQDGAMPKAPEGFTVTKFADSLRNPRNIYVAPNGDIFVTEANTESKGIKEKTKNAVSGKSKSQNMGESANDVLLFRDTNGDGKYDLKTVFLSGLNQPYGTLVVGNWFYVANTDGLWRFQYKAGQTKIGVPGEKILDLPAGGYNNHWTRNLIANKNGTKIYISVGSGSNAAEHGIENEIRRADILEVNPDGKGERIYAAGLRNPVGTDWNPATGKLYAVVNERDGLGDELVPDYLTSVQEGGFYGWPYEYFGSHPDPSVKIKKPDSLKKTIVPDMALGSHTASLGLAFYTGDKFPQAYRNGAFIGQHGSWNSSKLVGYKVAFVPFENGKPSGKLQDFLTGFIADPGKGDVHGRPVDVAVLKDGSLLVSDDAANTLWRVSPK